jgi:hypothetical protein
LSALCTSHNNDSISVKIATVNKNHLFVREMFVKNDIPY